MEELVTELRVRAEVAQQLCHLSASTTDRLLRPYKDRGLRRRWSTTKPGSLLNTPEPHSHHTGAGRTTSFRSSSALCGDKRSR